MTGVVDWYFRALRGFIALCLAVMVVLVFGNVVLRYAFNSGITISEELSRWLFVWLTFVGAVVALRDHAHLGMDSVVSRLPGVGQEGLLPALERADDLLRLPVLRWKLAADDHQHRQQGDRRRVFRPGRFYYSVGVFFSVMAAALLLRNVWGAVTGRLAERDLIQVRESEDEAKAEFTGKHDDTKGSGADAGAKS